MKLGIQLLIGLFVFLLIGSIVYGETQIAYDDFECNGFNCGSGWNGAWTYSGSCIITGTNALNNYNMRGTSSCSAIKTTDTTGYSEVNVSFYLTAGSLENNEYCYVYYNDGTTDHLLQSITNGDDDNTHNFYTFNVTAYGLSSSAGIRLVSPSGTGDYCYLDNVTIFGEQGLDINVYTDNYYLINTNVTIEMTSSLTNTQHILEINRSNGASICQKTTNSPSTAFTSFSTECQMPSTTDINATATFYPIGQRSQAIIKKFDIKTLTKDTTKLKIEKVYFSPQVLQGGSTEIYVLVKTTGVNISSAKVTLTFNDSTQRTLFMESTPNKNEYKAFITDTFQVGNVLFNVWVNGNNYYDTYNSQYIVAPYNVDFVQLVNQVSEVLNVKTVQNVNETTMQVHGTEYTAEDRGKVFIQLLDGDQQPLEDASCYASIYYPDDSPFKYKQLMTYVDEGLYNYNFDVPFPAGVYMVSSYCYVAGLNNTGKSVSDNFESGTTTGGTNWNGDWSLSGAELSTAQAYDGIYSMLIANDDDPDRDITSTLAYESVDISFWWRASSLESGEYVYFYLDDASSTPFLLETITDGDDDGVWHHSTTTLSGLSPDNFDFDGTLTFRGTTSNNLESGDYTWFDMINISLNTPTSNGTEEYQIVRGSGEVHVTTQNGIYTYDLNKGELRNTTFIDDFVFHFDVVSQTAVDLEEQDVKLKLWEPFPCDYIKNVTLRYANGSLLGLDYSSTFDERNRCEVKAVMDLETQATYDVEITTENYWKVEYAEKIATVLLEEEMINISCSNYRLANGLQEFVVPIGNEPVNLSQDALWQSCNSYLDASYGFKEKAQNFQPFLNINYNFTYEQMEGLEASYHHFRVLKERLEGYANTIFNGLGLADSYSLGLLADPYPPSNPLYAKYFAGISTSYLSYGTTLQVPTNVWNYSQGRNLTYYEAGNMDINETAIAEEVWNWSGFINSNILEYIADAIWEFIGGTAEII